MAASITTSSSALPKTNVNSAISTSAFSDSNTGQIVKNVSLTELKNAIDKLSTYMNKVSNCNNCIAYTIKSTSCQSTTCQSTGCQGCQKCQACQYCQKQCKYNDYNHGD